MWPNRCLCYGRYCLRCFICVNSFNLSTNLRGRCYEHTNFADTERLSYLPAITELISIGTKTRNLSSGSKLYALRDCATHREKSGEL